MTLEGTYTAEQVAESLQCSVWYVRDLVKQGVVVPLRLGAHPTAPMRFTSQHVAGLKSFLTPPAPAPRRRKRRAA